MAYGTEISIHALREEGDAALCDVIMAPHISIHALREEGDWPPLKSTLLHGDFYPRPPRGGRRVAMIPQGTRIHFYPRPPRGGRRRGGGNVTHGDGISIHALREEGDLTVGDPSGPESVFLSTPSARRATGGGKGKSPAGKDFYPRPPRGGRRPPLKSTLLHGDFYPRPPRGGRHRAQTGLLGLQKFLSTPSARRATGVRINR